MKVWVVNTANEEAIKTYIAKNKVKSTKKFIKIYNSFCGRCRQMANSNSSRPMEDYCTRCQQMAKSIWEE